MSEENPQGESIEEIEGKARGKRKSKFSPEFYREIGKKGGEKTRDTLGSDHFSRLGKKGGDTTKKTRPSNYYSRISKKRSNPEEKTPEKKQTDHSRAKEYGRRGGTKTRDTHEGHLQEISRKGGQASAEKRRNKPKQ